MMHLAGGPVRLLVYRWNEGMADDFLGDCSIELEELGEEARTFRRSLQGEGSAEEAASGELIFSICLKVVDV